MATFKIVFLSILSLVALAMAIPATPSTDLSPTDTNTNTTTRDDPRCHFKVTLMKYCDSDGYAIRVHEITDPWGKPAQGVENEGRWLKHFEKGEVTIGKIAGIPMTATYFPRTDKRDDQVLFIYPMQVWYDYEDNCSDRVAWRGDYFNGDLDHCPQAWYFYVSGLREKRLSGGEDDGS